MTRPPRARFPPRQDRRGGAGSRPPRLFRLPGPHPVTTLARSVKPALSLLRGRLDGIRTRIAEAARRSGRRPESVVLIGVTKTVTAEGVRDAIAAGLEDVGENRVQEAEEKMRSLGSVPVRWHLIGHLQRNKAGRAVTLFDRIHGVDDLELARTLSRRAEEAGRTVTALVQVNVGGEAGKFGVAPDALAALLREAASLPGLRIDGLMSIGPAVERSEDARPYFARTRDLRDASERALGLRLPELSMGMSGDFEVAIEEGSTMVRVGTALFGPRG
jgi:PLP dependent protein